MTVEANVCAPPMWLVVHVTAALLDTTTWPDLVAQVWRMLAFFLCSGNDIAKKWAYASGGLNSSHFSCLELFVAIYFLRCICFTITHERRVGYELVLVWLCRQVTNSQQEMIQSHGNCVESFPSWVKENYCLSWMQFSHSVTNVLSAASQLVHAPRLAHSHKSVTSPLVSVAADLAELAASVTSVCLTTILLLMEAACPATATQSEQSTHSATWLASVNASQLSPVCSCVL